RHDRIPAQRPPVAWHRAERPGPDSDRGARRMKPDKLSRDRKGAGQTLALPLPYGRGSSVIGQVDLLPAGAGDEAGDKPRGNALVDKADSAVAENRLTTAAVKTVNAFDIGAIDGARAARLVAVQLSLRIEGEATEAEIIIAAGPHRIAYFDVRPRLLP